MSGYATAALEPESDRSDPGPGTPEEELDSMSGYASADALDPEAPVNQPHAAGEAGGVKDPMSGYARADALDRESQPGARRSPERRSAEK